MTDWPATKPWSYRFAVSDDSRTLSTADASVEFMNGVADASKVEIKDESGALWAAVDMKDSAAAIRAIVNCVREHPPGDPASETTISGTGFFVAPNRVVSSFCHHRVRARCGHIDHDCRSPEANPIGRDFISVTEQGRMFQTSADKRTQQGFCRSLRLAPHTAKPPRRINRWSERHERTRR